jgi:hypothetical protein
VACDWSYEIDGISTVQQGNCGSAYGNDMWAEQEVMG